MEFPYQFSKIVKTNSVNVENMDQEDKKSWVSST